MEAGAGHRLPGWPGAGGAPARPGERRGRGWPVVLAWPAQAAWGMVCAGRWFTWWARLARGRLAGLCPPGCPSLWFFQWPGSLAGPMVVFPVPSLVWSFSLGTNSSPRPSSVPEHLKFTSSEHCFFSPRPREVLGPRLLCFWIGFFLQPLSPVGGHWWSPGGWRDSGQAPAPVCVCGGGLPGTTVRAACDGDRPAGPLMLSSR